MVSSTIPVSSEHIICCITKYKVALSMQQFTIIIRYWFQKNCAVSIKSFFYKIFIYIVDFLQDTNCGPLRQLRRCMVTRVCLFALGG